MKVRAEELRAGDVVAIGGYVVKLAGAELLHSDWHAASVVVKWNAQGMIPAGREVLFAADVVTVQR